MNTINDTPENLDSDIDNETIDNEPIAIPSFDKKSHKRYFHKVRLLGWIHADIASQVKALREADGEDYTNTNLLGLHLASLKL